MFCDMGPPNRRAYRAARGIALPGYVRDGTRIGQTSGMLLEMAISASPSPSRFRHRVSWFCRWVMGGAAAGLLASWTFSVFGELCYVSTGKLEASVAYGYF